MIEVFVIAIPQGPVITYNFTDNTSGSATAPPSEFTHTRSTVTTVVLTLDAQSFKWKAYVGNVTGSLALADADGYEVYAWDLGTSYSGEIYATRKADVVNWSNIGCADSADITVDESDLSQASSDTDSISNTFTSRNHSWFRVATTDITNTTCYAVHTFNLTGTPQDDTLDAVFQEVVLSDGNATVYTTIMEDNAPGFDVNINGTQKRYDFQMLVPENPASGHPATTYYFYMELS